LQHKFIQTLKLPQQYIIQWSRVLRSGGPNHSKPSRALVCSSTNLVTSKTLRPLLILGFIAGALRHSAGDFLSDNSACQAGKQVGAHHPHKNVMMTDRPLELLHMDLFDPIAYISIGGSKYCLVIMDDYSRFTWVFFLQEKSQTQETLKGFLRRAQNEYGLRIKKIRSDNGTKFKNSQIEGFLEEEGIKHEFSSPYTPQQNGVVERKNRTLLDMARTMLDEYKTSNRFWAEAINTACYSINRLYLH
jgi:transposase InsO family protein